MERDRAARSARVGRDSAAKLLVGVALVLATAAFPAGSLARGGESPPAVRLPADLRRSSFPLPPGALQASNGASPHWTVGILVKGTANGVHRAVLDFYRAHGFTADITPYNDSTVHDRGYRVDFVARSVDTSGSDPNQTIVALDITALSRSTARPPSHRRHKARPKHKRPPRLAAR